MLKAGTAFEIVLISGPGSNRFLAFVPDGDGGRLAEHPFEWHLDSATLAMDQGALARAATGGTPPAGDPHVRFGRRLHEAAFGGAVGELWRVRLREYRRQGLRLVLRIDPSSARMLLNLPWEYLHDGEDFLALSWRTPLSRLPWGLPVESLPALAEPLRLLVVISAPLGLPANMVLNFAQEEDILLAATAGARRAGKLEVAFAPNGSLAGVEEALREHDPHLLHFTGHGVFDPGLDTGLLLMETPDGHEQRVPNGDFARLLERRARSLRLVFLSACQSAAAPRQDGYADLSPRLLKSGIPAVVAMGASILDRSASEFGAAFYRGVADGEPLDGAVAEARGRLAEVSANGVDFATPILFLSDPSCLRVEVGTEGRRQAALDLTGLTAAQHFVGRSAELRELQTRLDPQHGSWRGAVLHGLGGMGKTVLAARLAERMGSSLDGVTSLRMTPTTTAQHVLGEISGFLLSNNGRFNSPLVPQFARLIEDDGKLSLEGRAARLIEILRTLRLLVVFDNCEDVFGEGRPVSRSAAAEVDPALPRLVGLLAEGVPGPSRLLFTTRVDFDPVGPGRLTGAIGHVGLGEMGFREAVYLMETLPPLDALPMAAAEPGLSKRGVYRQVGGHPYTINLFAEHVRRSSVERVLDDLSEVRGELLEFTLLDRAMAHLPARGAEVLRRGAIFEEPVLVGGLAYLLGDETNASPQVDVEVAALLGWGLLSRPPGTELLAMPVVVRDWARGRIAEAERRDLLRRAAHYWLAVGRESRSLEPELNAHHYLFEAGDYEAADEIVDMATEYLHRWGSVELLHRLLTLSVRTLVGLRRAVALRRLGTLHEKFGDYATARQYHQEALVVFEKEGDRPNIAASLHGLGMINQLQGDYEPARELYNRSMAIREEIGDRRGVSGSLHHLGILQLERGDYEGARELYERSLEIKQEIGDREGVATSLHELGLLHHRRGEYDRARDLYEQSLEIVREFGDLTGMSTTLYQLGTLHQDQGQYERARQCLEQSQTIAAELGDRAGVARILHELGNLHYLEGEVEPARELYEQSLAIKEELGNRVGMAVSMGQLGNLYERRGDHGRARELFERSLAIARELGDRQGIARSMCELGRLHHLKGEYEPARELYEQSLAIAQELEDRVGAGRVLNLMGGLLESQGRLVEALPLFAHALAFLDPPGAPERWAAREALSRLRAGMGEEAFIAALEQALPGTGPALVNAGSSQALTLEQAVDLVINNTVAVSTTMGERRGEWATSLRQIREAAQGDTPQFAEFVGLALQFVEGIGPDHLTPRVPPEFQPAWQAILAAVR